MSGVSTEKVIKDHVATASDYSRVQMLSLLVPLNVNVNAQGPGKYKTGLFRLPKGRYQSVRVIFQTLFYGPQRAVAR